PNQRESETAPPHVRMRTASPLPRAKPYSPWIPTTKLDGSPKSTPRLGPIDPPLVNIEALAPIDIPNQAGQDELAGAVAASSPLVSYLTAGATRAPATTGATGSGAR